VAYSGIAISNRRGCRAFLTSAVFLASPLLAAANRRADLSVSARLVLIPVTVTDRHGKAIPGLGPEHFQVLKDSKPREALSLSRQDGPASAGVLPDWSGSMRRHERGAVAAAREIAAALDDRDEMFLMTFGDRPKVAAPDQLRTARAHGGTALVDAVWLALDEARARSRHRPALVVVFGWGRERQPARVVRTQAEGHRSGHPDP
jgi:hypothetical protein